MKGLFAALQKDLKLFFSGTGVIALFLPVLLFFALQWGVGDMAKEAYVAPFSIAVRDEDNTVMSRSLTNQMRQIDLFSEVLKAEGTQSDSFFLEQGAAAVVTIPEHFFYTMYSMNNDAVTVVLNDAMPLQAHLLKSVLSSVVDIISANQSTGRVVYRTLYGSLTPELENQLWDETSNLLIKDALSRQQVFDTSSARADTQTALSRTLLACTVSVLCLFFPLSAVKTVPEEMQSGILPRFLSAGGSLFSFFFSKLLTAAVLALPSLLLLFYAFQIQHWLLILTCGIFFCSGFSMMLFVAICVQDGPAAQRAGNLILLLSLVLGGALYPIALLPAAVQRVSVLTLPYYVNLAVQWNFSELGLSGLILQLLPLLCLLCLFPISMWKLQHTGPRRKKAPQTGSTQAVQFLSIKKAISPGTFPAIILLKLKNMSGGMAGFLSMTAICLICSAVVTSALGKTPETLRIAVEVQDNSPQAEKLLEMLEAQQGLSVFHCSSTQGQELLSLGKAEGLLVVGNGYGAAVSAGKLPLSYKSAASAASAQAAREIIAGQVNVQRIYSRGLHTIAARSGETLTQARQDEILGEMQAEITQIPTLYHFSLGSGKPVSANPYAPSAYGFALLAVMLTVFTWCAWVGKTDARQVERRIAAQHRGLMLSYCTDLFSLLSVAFLAAAATMLFMRPAYKEVLGLLAYGFCVTGLGLALVRFSALSGRIDILAPFLALITSLLGGSFGDITQFSPALQIVSHFTPQGLALWARQGKIFPAAILLLLGAIFIGLGMPKKDRSSYYAKKKRAGY